MLAAFDLGTRTGYAAKINGAIVSGVFDFRPQRFEGGGMRYLRFRRKLDELHAVEPITEVAFEEVRAHRGVDASHVFGGLLALLTSWCEENGVPYRGVGVAAIKKFATGRGNADKAAMIAAVRGWGFEPADDNEADALALLHLVAAETGV